MAKRLLNKVDGRPAVEAVAGVRMTQPVGRDLGREPGPFGSGFDDAVHLAGIEWPALAGAEHGPIRVRAAADLAQGSPGVGGEEHDAGFAALAVDRDLTRSVALGEITPAQAADL